VPLHNAYGLTETTSPLTITPLGTRAPVDPASGALSVGVPVFDTTVEVLADDGTPVTPGEIGEIVAAGPQVVPGYWEKPDETRIAMPDGRLRTGDVGYFDRLPPAAVGRHVLVEPPVAAAAPEADAHRRRRRRSARAREQRPDDGRPHAAGARVRRCRRGHFQLLDEHTSALRAIGEFLAADDLEDAPVWRSAVQVDHAQAAEQTRFDGLGALPWGAVSAAFRRVRW
jgi:hypothetical protein